MDKGILNIIMIFAILTSALMLFIPVNVILKVLVISIIIFIVILNYVSNKNK